VASTLILYSTVDGQTKRIALRLQQMIEAFGHAVQVVAIEDAAALDLATYDQIVIGASIRYGHHRPSVLEFIRQNQALLERKANAFFSVNIVARKAEKNRPETNPYLQKFLRQIDWKPQRLAVFAGRLDYPSYGFFDRQMIRLIMWITKGPTDPAAVVEFTDWSAVEAFGQALGRSSTADLP
jgi:menaquinone-dependent protoporphyrinogen oxidase